MPLCAATCLPWSQDAVGNSSIYIYFAEIAGASLRHPCRSQFMCALIITFLYRKVSVDRNAATDFPRCRAGIRSRNHRNTDIVTVVLAARYDVCYEIVRPGRKPAFRSVSKKNTSAGRFWWLPSSSPSKIRPGTPASGREALLRNIKYRSLAQGRPRGFEFKRAPYDVLTFGPSPMGPIGGPHKHTSTG